MVLSLAVPVAVALVAFDRFMIPRFFRPLGYFLCGVPWERFVPEKHVVLEQKFPVYFESGLLHLVELAATLYYAYSWTWWRDPSDWPQNALLVLDTSNPPHAAERDFIAPFYIFYFGYVMFTFVRDLFLKKDRTGGNFTFTIHHVLTVALTATSFHYGEWRAGFITRLCLGLGEVTLYFGKCYSAREQVGNGSRGLLGAIFLLNFIVWGGMRCLAYGWLCYSLTIMYLREKPTWANDQFAACTAMLVGSWAMLCLQLLWTPFICTAGLKYLRTGKMDDPVHRDLKNMKEVDKKKA